MTQIIDGKLISSQIKDEVKERVAALKAKGREVTLAVVLVGEDPASQVYVNNKKKACEYCGINSVADGIFQQVLDGCSVCQLAEYIIKHFCIYYFSIW